MRELPQWVLAGADKVPLGLGADGQLRPVSATRPSEWMSFERAVAIAWMHTDLVTTYTTKEGQVITRTGLDLGFALHEDDPFTCIDLDTKDAETHPDKPEVWTTTDQFDRYISIINTMHSYTERSRSGKGIHVWVRGNIGRGFRRDGVEVYSQERYIIMTGDVYVNEPIMDRGQTLENMVARMRPIASEIELEELPPHTDDWYIFEVAATAGNAEKFWKLWRGQWQEDFPSQSEADLALMSMFTFYSDSNAQCRSLFRASALGQREKTTKNDYHVNKMLKLLRSRQAREAAVDLSGIIEADRSATAAAVAAAQDGAAANVATSREVQHLSTPGQGNPVQPPPPTDSALAQLAPVPPEIVAAGADGLAWPPGFVGTVAKFIYANSYLPVKEVAVVGALGLMAGLCGKAWNIPGSGLNLYIVLVARSAIGKEAMHSGISTLVAACQKNNPFIGNFVDFAEQASGPALIKACLASPSFVNVSGEWGRRMKRMAAEDGRDGPLASLRTQMTNLYQKSGSQSMTGGINYSSTENNVASITGVAYSMIGETTPGTFYESLTDSMMEDGFLSRFLIIGYDGDRPARNRSFIKDPDPSLVSALNNICNSAHSRCSPGIEAMAVGRTEEAASLLDAFEHESDKMILSTDNPSRRQMWNRAALKTLRVAALLAVGDHYLSPCITKAHAQWAIDLIRQDIAMMQKRLDEGDVGQNDTSRERKLVAILRQYQKVNSIPKSYNIPKDMHNNHMVTHSYLVTRTQSVAAFSGHKFGSNKALKETVESFIDNGWLMEVKKEKVVELFGLQSKTYRILHLPDYVEQDKK